MITLEEIVATTDLTPRVVTALAEHEHVSEVCVAAVPTPAEDDPSRRLPGEEPSPPPLQADEADASPSFPEPMGTPKPQQPTEPDPQPEGDDQSRLPERDPSPARMPPESIEREDAGIDGPVDPERGDPSTRSP